MNRYAPYLGIVAALVVFVWFVSQGPLGAREVVYVSEAPLVPLVATSTEALKPVASSASPKAAPVAKDVVLASAAKLRTALVNVICYAPPESGVHSITGSGVVVGSKGYILTNAHVAEYFLLADRGVSCEVRTGSPATTTYKAALVYLSPAWMGANVRVITDAAPHGTGEHDIALLAPVAATASQPYVPLSRALPRLEQQVAIATYGAQFLEASQIKSALFPTVVLGRVGQILTFTSTTPDVLAFEGSPAAQEGSSGGGVVSAEGELVGMVTTSAVTGATAERVMSALTAPYIRREYEGQTGQSLDTLLKSAPSGAIAAFLPAVESLRAGLEQTLDTKK